MIDTCDPVRRRLGGPASPDSVEEIRGLGLFGWYHGGKSLPRHEIRLKCRIQSLEPFMTTAARFDLKRDADEKAIVAKAAALLGTTMAGFVRLAAKEKTWCCSTAKRAHAHRPRFHRVRQRAGLGIRSEPGPQGRPAQVRRKVRRA